jgi:NDP-sugar pyrophosphorylase family protein
MAMQSAGRLFEDFTDLSLGVQQFTPERLLTCHELIDRLEDEVMSRCQARTGPLVDDTAEVHPTAILGEGVFVGPGVTIGPYCYLRSWCVLLDNVTVGYGVELDRLVLGPGVKIAHQACVGRSVVGARSNLAFGFVTATKRLSGKPVAFALGTDQPPPAVISTRSHHGMVMGEDCTTGVHVSVMPGASIRPGCRLLPHRSYDGFVE